jgi:hypothetical protein
LVLLLLLLLLLLWYWGWNSGSWLAKQVLHHLSHIPALLYISYFSDRLLLFCQELTLDHDPPMYVPWTAGITNAITTSTYFLRWSPANFFAWVILELQSSQSLSPKWMGLQSWATVSNLILFVLSVIFGQ